MSDAIVAAIIIATVPSIISTFTYFRIRKVHVEINSRVDEMIKLVRSEATATERLAGMDRRKGE